MRDSGNFSYGYNDWGTGQDPTTGTITRDGVPTPSSKQRGLGGDVYDAGGKELKVSRVRKAAEMIAIADTTPDGIYDQCVDPCNPKEAPSAIHKGGSNILWCDGHVTWKLQKELVLFDPKRPTIKYQKGLVPAWDVIAMQWNNDNRP
jgi:prepilin-type processing-associated H-X9-DG protein